MESPRAAATAFLDHLRDARDVSPHTLRAYNGELERLLLWLSHEADDISAISQLDGRSLRAFIASRAEAGSAPASIARSVAAIRSFGRYLLRSERLEANPADSLRAPRQGRKLPHVLDDSDIRALLAAPEPTSEAGTRDRAILEILYGAGLRVSELVSLCDRRVKADRNELHVLGKGRKERLAPVVGPALDALATYQQRRNSAHGHDPDRATFLSLRGKPLHDRDVRRI
ncbi:MAG: site-specific integrase, partial [Planctomycetota bacterium]